jgi:hypothetical protein
MRIAELENSSMTIIQAQWIGEQALLSKEDFERLLALARKCEPIDVQTPYELPTEAMMKLAEVSGSFDFWNDCGEDVYSVEDGEPV